MKKSCVGLALMGLLMGTGILVAAADVSPALSTNEVSAAKQRYDLIQGNLDAGGDLLVIVNMDGWVKDAVASVVKPVLAMGGDEPGFQPVAACLGKLHGFLDKNGFYALQGLGLSLVPRNDGLNTLKCYIARDQNAIKTPLWRALVGGAPRKLVCTDFLPPDTELARTGTGEMDALWKMVRSGVSELGTPAFAADFDKQLSVMTTNFGVNLDKVMGSMNGESFCSVQFSKTETIRIPTQTPGAPVIMPKPSFLLGVEVKDNALVEALEAAVTKSKVMSVSNAPGGLKTINLPFTPPPFVPFKPAYTVYKGFFLLGSTPEAVASAIKSFTAKNGLAATPEFRKAFEGLSFTNNGMAYMSPRCSGILMDMQKAMMANESGGGARMAPMMDSLWGWQRDMSNAEVFVNKRNGVAIMGTTSVSGKNMAASVMLAPVGLMAAIAIPSFMKARTVSQGNACINNLRMLEAAKEQWALENKKKEGDSVVEAGILKYMKGGQMRRCPQGGDYTLGVIGENARCSCPGHQLQ
ncbi:MAG: hypothetical protein WCG36_02835 [bacterium]